ncbi:hypothetical protein EVAR_33435_1 [Eumeta japonica]|uniref:Uncharacterized protein n=1 Tax=Eumeta variegata TaxID=151549 RepID=A0A4C1W4K4_EUMVA|nr:hypothetical protein EVAR_33435_1 [Eumeta japonica]
MNRHKDAVYFKTTRGLKDLVNSIRSTTTTTSTILIISRFVAPPLQLHSFEKSLNKRISRRVALVEVRNADVFGARRHRGRWTANSLNKNDSAVRKGEKVL